MCEDKEGKKEIKKEREEKRKERKKERNGEQNKIFMFVFSDFEWASGTLVTG